MLAPYLNHSVVDARHWDILTDEQRIRVLEMGGYTGMLSTEEDLTFSNLYRATSKRDMVDTLQEVLGNLKDGYNMEDENHYVYQFLNGKKVFYSENLERPLSAKDVDRLGWLSASGGLSKYRYWTANDAAKAEMMRSKQKLV